MEKQNIIGIAIMQEDGRLEVFTEFSLTKEEEATIWEILKNHETDGSSIVGTKEEIIEEFSTPKPAGNLIPTEGKEITAAELEKLLKSSDKDATIAVASGYKTFPITGGFVTGGKPYLESEDLAEYLEKYSME